ncbi:MAG: hypothetical protein H6732_00020 [Alphaproteobacteria bacterium]|nr:hypothetical protein [Alphaproteobacteria bacterium]
MRTCRALASLLLVAAAACAPSRDGRDDTGKDLDTDATRDSGRDTGGLLSGDTDRTPGHTDTAVPDDTDPTGPPAVRAEDLDDCDALLPLQVVRDACGAPVFPSPSPPEWRAPGVTCTRALSLHVPLLDADELVLTVTVEASDDDARQRVDALAPAGATAVPLGHGGWTFQGPKVRGTVTDHLGTRAFTSESEGRVFRVDNVVVALLGRDHSSSAVDGACPGAGLDALAAHLVAAIPTVTAPTEPAPTPFALLDVLSPAQVSAACAAAFTADPPTTPTVGQRWTATPSLVDQGQLVVDTRPLDATAEGLATLWQEASRTVPSADLRAWDVPGGFAFLSPVDDDPSLEGQIVAGVARGRQLLQLDLWWDGGTPPCSLDTLEQLLTDAAARIPPT